MKRFTMFLSFLLALSMLLIGCNSNISSEAPATEATKAATEAPPPWAAYDCFTIEPEHKGKIDTYLKGNYGGKVFLKIHQTSTIYSETVEAISKGDFDYFEKPYCIYLVDTHLPNSEIALSANFGVVKRTEYSPDAPDVPPAIKYPDWQGQMLEYLKDPSKIFGDSVVVEDVKCFGTMAFFPVICNIDDFLVYFETDKGDYILYYPLIYNYDNVENMHTDIATPIGYQDMYLFPPSVLQGAVDFFREYEEKYYEENQAPALAQTWDTESQLYRVIDLEPYKLVPGKLPE